MKNTGASTRWHESSRLQLQSSCHHENAEGATAKSTAHFNRNLYPGAKNLGSMVVKPAGSATDLSVALKEKLCRRAWRKANGHASHSAVRMTPNSHPCYHSQVNSESSSGYGSMTFGCGAPTNTAKRWCAPCNTFAFQGRGHNQDCQGKAGLQIDQTFLNDAVRNAGRTGNEKCELL